MKEQNFKKHARYVPGFHFLTLSIIVASLVIAIILLVGLIVLLAVFIYRNRVKIRRAYSAYVYEKPSTSTPSTPENSTVGEVDLSS